MAISLPERTMTAVRSLTPREIVAELDKYVIGQAKAKRAVAIALRNRLRRQRLSSEMAEEVTAYLEANGILDAVTYQVATQEDLLALLRADLGVAVMPVAGMEADGICCIPLKQLNLARPVSAYTVAGRHREIVCATLFNMLRAADWGFDTKMKQRARAHR